MRERNETGGETFEGEKNTGNEKFFTTMKEKVKGVIKLQRRNETGGETFKVNNETGNETFKRE